MNLGYTLVAIFSHPVLHGNTSLLSMIDCYFYLNFSCKDGDRTVTHTHVRSQPAFSDHTIANVGYVHHQNTECTKLKYSHTMVKYQKLPRTTRHMQLDLSTDSTDHAIDEVLSSGVRYSNRWLSLQSLIIGRISEMKNIDLALCRGDGMGWAERQRKSRDMRRGLQLITYTTQVKDFLSSTISPHIIDAFQEARAYGAIIHLNRTSFHVFLVGTAHDIEHICLPAKDIGTRLKEIIAHLSEQGRASNSSPQRRKMMMVPTQLDTQYAIDVNRVLGDVWRVLVKPILAALKLLVDQPLPQKEMSHRRRIVWCPTGSLTMLPLHAAGIYDGPMASQDNVSNYAVSSYTPTLSAFCRAVKTKAPPISTSESTSSVALVAQQPKAASYGSIPEVDVEAKMIRHLIPGCRTGDFSAITNNSDFDSALRNVRNVEILHFACHGSQDQRDPLNSGLELEKGRLTLKQFTEIDFPNGQLAYLSSCESASIDFNCPDSGINLATTLLFNGFRSVIGTMWLVNSSRRMNYKNHSHRSLYRSMIDHDGPFIAERVYRRVFRNGKIDRAAIPWALDEAVRELRATGVPAIRWATYIHMGA
jgi:hypothetical protein